MLKPSKLTFSLMFVTFQNTLAVPGRITYRPLPIRTDMSAESTTASR